MQWTEIHKKLPFLPTTFPHSPTITTTTILIAKMIGLDQPPSSFKQKAFRKLSSETSLRSILSYESSSIRPNSVQSQRSFTTCRSKFTTCDSSILKEDQSNDQLLYQKDLFNLANSFSSSSASINEKLNKTRLGKKLKNFVSRLKADWNGMVYKKTNKAKSVNSKKFSTIDVAYEQQESFTSENYFVHSSDVPQYAGIISSMNQKHYRSRIVTFDVDDDPFAAKSPMKLIAGKPVQPNQHERSLEVSRIWSLFSKLFY